MLGVDDPELEMERICHMLRDGIKPDIMQYASVEIVNEEGFDILKVKVLRGSKRPYYLNEKGMRGNGVYVRHGVISAPASEEMIRNMLKESDGMQFDQMRTAHQELTFSYADYIFKEHEVAFSDVNKRTLGLIDQDGCYTNTAYLLSDQCTYSIKCAVYQGKTKSVFKARKEFSGSILKQLDDAITYLDMFSNDNTEIKQFARVDIPD